MHRHNAYLLLKQGTFQSYCRYPDLRDSCLKYRFCLKQILRRIGLSEFRAFNDNFSDNKNLLRTE